MATKVKHHRIFRAFLIIPLAIIIVTASVYEIGPVLGTSQHPSPWSNNSSDQEAVVNWLNANTDEGDMVAAAAPIDYLLKKAMGVDYAEVALYETREPFHIYTMEQLSRYKIDVSLSKFKYFVIDTPLYDLGGPAAQVAGEVKSLWQPVYNVGDYQVYRNLGQAATRLTAKWWIDASLTGLTKDSRVTADETGIYLNAASATGEQVYLGIQTRLRYSVPLTITIDHTIPTLDTVDMHAYDFEIQNGADFIIIHYLNNPGGYIEVGTEKDGKWFSQWVARREPPPGPIEWTIELSSKQVVLFENGVRQCQVDNILTAESFSLVFSHVTRDATPKTWIINSVEVNGERIQ